MPRIQRQVHIKTTMSLENRSFYEASKLVPLLPNKNKNTRNLSYFLQSEYPALPIPTSIVDVMTINYRTDVHRKAYPDFT